jgi:predicted component of type VI protein secretion system
MDLILRVVAHVDAASTAPIVARFDAGGGLIGRAETARLILPDTRKTVSRFHANVSCEDGRYYVEDMGSTNPAAVNGARLAAGTRHELRPGDRLQIGDYTIAVEFDDPLFARTVVVERPGADERTQLVARAAQVAAPPGTAGAVSADDLWSAFQDGAQIQIELPHGPRPELMRVIGVLLRGSIAGLRRLLQLRAAAKREVDADVTTIRSRNNNPLKFAPDDTRAMTAMLKPPMASFLTGPAAIEDSFADLESHALATNVALHRAIERTLARFDPDELEKRLSGGGVLDALVPMSRKAKLWELYLDQHRAIRREAEDSFEDAFTRAFAEAYEKEVARLKKGQG